MRTLTKDGRRGIMGAVIAHAFKDRVHEFLDVEDQLKRDIIDRIYPKEIQAHMTALIEFAEHMPFTTFHTLTVNVRGQQIPVGYVRHHYDPKDITIQVEDLVNMVIVGTERVRNVSIPVLRLNSSSSQPLLAVPEGDKLGERIEAYWEMRVKLKADVNAKRGTIMGILAHIKNEGQLKAKWPEVMSIADKFLTGKVEKRDLVAVPMDELNAELGLPVDNDNQAELETEAA
jgi:hypothetical protein